MYNIFMVQTGIFSSGNAILLKCRDLIESFSTISLNSGYADYINRDVSISNSFDRNSICRSSAPFSGLEVRLAKSLLYKRLGFSTNNFAGHSRRHYENA